MALVLEVQGADCHLQECVEAELEPYEDTFDDMLELFVQCVWFLHCFRFHAVVYHSPQFVADMAM